MILAFNFLTRKCPVLGYRVYPVRTTRVIYDLPATREYYSCLISSVQIPLTTTIIITILISITHLMSTHEVNLQSAVKFPAEFLFHKICCLMTAIELILWSSVTDKKGGGYERNCPFTKKKKLHNFFFFHQLIFVVVRKLSEVTLSN